MLQLGLVPENVNVKIQSSAAVRARPAVGQRLEQGGGSGLTPNLGGSTVLNLGGERRARPNVVGNPELPDSERTLARWFNTDAFAAFSPAPQAFGNAGVGIMRGPGLANFDFTLAKNFPLTDRRYIQFRTEFFNAFNRVNFGPPNIARELERVRPDSDRRKRANHPVRAEVLFLISSFKVLDGNWSYETHTTATLTL
jgi:hypothetical protein